MNDVGVSQIWCNLVEMALGEKQQGHSTSNQPGFHKYGISQIWAKKFLKIPISVHTILDDDHY